MYSLNSLSVMLKSRCMEKSQAKGIESYVMDSKLYPNVCDAWKNPKQRELKVRYVPSASTILACDAWKNPKQRELKETSLDIFPIDFIADAWKNPKQRELKVNYTEHFNNFIVG